LNGNHATCPEFITSTWNYYSESEKRWKKDESFTAECNDGTGGVVEVEDEDYNEYGDYFYGFDYSQFSNVWFENLRNND
jgi:hypothetical protein